jgi:hypothetical protein
VCLCVRDRARNKSAIQQLIAFAVLMLVAPITAFFVAKPVSMGEQLAVCACGFD